MDVFVPITNAECVLPPKTGGRKTRARRVTRRRLALRKTRKASGGRRLALFRRTKGRRVTRRRLALRRATRHRK